jgi:hypothetical protein
MIRHASAVAFAAILASVSVGFGQTGQIAITPEQRSKIKAHVLQEQRSSLAPPSGFAVAVGATLPAGITLYWMPPEAGVNRYRYTIVCNRAVVVDPDSRQVLEILDAPAEQTAAPTAQKC